MMRWLKRLHAQLRMKEQNTAQSLLAEKQEMHMEICKAYMDWQAANNKLEWAMEKDQIDYAIYSLEAAEKRYEMLLRQAKKLDWQDGVVIASRTFHSAHSRTASQQREG